MFAWALYTKVQTHFIQYFNLSYFTITVNPPLTSRKRTLSHVPSSIQTLHFNLRWVDTSLKRKLFLAPVVSTYGRSTVLQGLGCLYSRFVFVTCFLFIPVKTLIAPWTRLPSPLVNAFIRCPNKSGHASGQSQWAIAEIAYAWKWIIEKGNHAGHRHSDSPVLIGTLPIS